MTHVLNANSHTFNPIARLHDMIANFRTNRARRAKFERAYGALQSLSDSELVEFGLHRSDLVDLARTEAMKNLR